MQALLPPPDNQAEARPLLSRGMVIIFETVEKELLRPANTDQDLEHHTAWTQQLVIPVLS